VTLSAHSDFSLRVFCNLIRCNLLQRSSARFLAGDFAISLQHLTEFGLFGEHPSDQNHNRHAKLQAEEIFD
jgi:hypothetical protein